MYIIAIAWLYVTVLMAATEPSITAGILTFVFYGLLPCALFIWVFGTPQRNRQRQKQLQAPGHESQPQENQSRENQSAPKNQSLLDDNQSHARIAMETSQGGQLTLKQVLSQPDGADTKHD